MYNGKKALEYLDTAQPDLIMSDLRLEDMDGIDLLKKIKKNMPLYRLLL